MVQSRAQVQVVQSCAPVQQQKQVEVQPRAQEPVEVQQVQMMTPLYMKNALPVTQVCPQTRCPS